MKQEMKLAFGNEKLKNGNLRKGLLRNSILILTISAVAVPLKRDRLQVRVLPGEPD